MFVAPRKWPEGHLRSGCFARACDYGRCASCAVERLVPGIGKDDIFIDPGAGSTLNAESMLNAETLLGVPPAGDGCAVTFDDIRFTRDRLGDLRGGS